MNEEPNQEPTLIAPTTAIPPSPPPAPSAAPAPSDGLWSGGDGDSDGPVGTEADDVSGSGSKKSARTWIIAGIAAAVLAVGSVVGISVVSGHTASSAATTTAAAGQNGGPGGGFGGGTAGTISAIDGSTITLTGTTGTATKVTTSSSTTVTSSATAALGDIAVGDQVSVMGTISGTDVTAQRITDTGTTADAGPGQGQAPPSGSGQTGQAPPSGAGGPGAGARGQVTSIDGSTMVITATDGTVYTVTTSSTTTVTKVTTSSLSALSVGEQVQVRGSTATDGTVTAERITEGAATGFPGGGGGPPTGSGPTN